MSQARFLLGDVFERMAELPDASVDCIVTSPPFLALRSYLPADHPDKSKEIGSEPTPAAFLSTLLALTREWRRVLAPHGSICVELGDTYAGSGGAGGDYRQGGWRDGEQPFDGSAKHARIYGDGMAHPIQNKNGKVQGGGPGWPLAKSLTGIPTLYAWSLAYGYNLLDPADTVDPWRIRNLIAWHRPNPPVGALYDKVRPSTSYVTVACTSTKRWFDLDAERTAHARDYSDEKPGGQTEWNRNGMVEWNRTVVANPAGAPPLDTWIIPTQPYVTPEGLIVVPSGGSSHRVRVPVGAGGDGIQRTTSPDCPLHGSEDHRGSSAPDGGRGDTESTHNAHSDARPGLEPPLSLLPTPASSDQSDSSDGQPGPAATPRSTASNRTGRAPATSHVDTPSVETTGRTDDTSTSPSPAAPRLDTSESRTSPGAPDARCEPQTTDDTAGTPRSEPCTCSYWVDVDVASEDTSDYATFPADLWNIPTQGFSGAHYATFPVALPRKLINLMCPRQVCTVCGEPRRRITSVDYEPHSVKRDEPKSVRGMGVQNGEHAQAFEHGRATKNVETLGWTDCGHSTPDREWEMVHGHNYGYDKAKYPLVDNYRRGIVLDPFAGSGTTLVAASELGRDSIGIDIDDRNLDLAIERCGLFLAVDD